MILQNVSALDWLTKDWRLIIQQPYLEALLAGIAVLCGGLVGEEREKHEKPAGLRTLMLVCLGSAIFTMASFFFTTTSGDSGRVAAQIVTGVGFLGAGVIMRDRGIISGTTTAATIWVMAAIGVIVGAGYGGAAVCATILVRLVLGGISLYETRLAGEMVDRTVKLDFDPDAGRTRLLIERILADYRQRSVGVTWEKISDELGRLTVHIRLQHRPASELLADLVEVRQVKSVREL